MVKMVSKTSEQTSTTYMLFLLDLDLHLSKQDKYYFLSTLLFAQLFVSLVLSNRFEVACQTMNHHLS